MRLAIVGPATVAVALAFALGRITAPAGVQAGVEKIESSTTFSHFLCYQAQISPSVSDTVGLVDQFNNFQTTTGSADMFCTPVKKTPLNYKPLKVPPPADHLTCYHIQGPSTNQSRKFTNQFESGGVTVVTPVYLCAPTHKFG